MYFSRQIVITMPETCSSKMEPSIETIIDKKLELLEERMEAYEGMFAFTFAALTLCIFIWGFIALQILFSCEAYAEKNNMKTRDCMLSFNKVYMVILMGVRDWLSRLIEGRH